MKFYKNDIVKILSIFYSFLIIMSVVINVNSKFKENMINRNFIFSKKNENKSSSSKNTNNSASIISNSLNSTIKNNNTNKLAILSPSKSPIQTNCVRVFKERNFKGEFKDVCDEASFKSTVNDYGKKVSLKTEKLLTLIIKFQNYSNVIDQNELPSFDATAGLSYKVYFLTVGKMAIFEEIEFSGRIFILENSGIKSSLPGFSKEAAAEDIENQFKIRSYVVSKHSYFKVIQRTKVKIYGDVKLKDEDTYLSGMNSYYQSLYVDFFKWSYFSLSDKSLEIPSVSKGCLFFYSNSLFKAENDTQIYLICNRVQAINNIDTDRRKYRQGPEDDQEITLDSNFRVIKDYKSILLGSDTNVILFDAPMMLGNTYFLSGSHLPVLPFPIKSLMFIDKHCVYFFEKKFYKKDYIKICQSVDNFVEAWWGIRSPKSVIVGSDISLIITDLENLTYEVSYSLNSLSMAQIKKISLKIKTTGETIEQSTKYKDKNKCIKLYNNIEKNDKSALYCEDIYNLNTVNEEEVKTLNKIADTKTKLKNSMRKKIFFNLTVSDIRKKKKVEREKTTAETLDSNNKIRRINAFNHFKYIEIPEKTDILIYHSASIISNLNFKFLHYDTVTLMSDSGRLAIDANKISKIEIFKSGCVIFYEKVNYKGKYLKLCESTPDIRSEPKNNIHGSYKSVLFSESTKIILYKIKYYNTVIDANSSLEITESTPNIESKYGAKGKGFVTQLASVDFNKSASQKVQVVNTGSKFLNFIMGIILSVSGIADKDQVNNCIPDFMKAEISEEDLVEKLKEEDKEDKDKEEEIMEDDKQEEQKSEQGASRVAVRNRVLKKAFTPIGNIAGILVDFVYLLLGKIKFLISKVLKFICFAKDKMYELKSWIGKMVKDIYKEQGKYIKEKIKSGVSAARQHLVRRLATEKNEAVKTAKAVLSKAWSVLKAGFERYIKGPLRTLWDKIKAVIDKVKGFFNHPIFKFIKKAIACVKEIMLVKDMKDTIISAVNNIIKFFTSIISAVSTGFSDFKSTFFIFDFLLLNFCHYEDYLAAIDLFKQGMSYSKNATTEKEVSWTFYGLGIGQILNIFSDENTITGLIEFHDDLKEKGLKAFLDEDEDEDEKDKDKDKTEDKKTNGRRKKY